MKHNLNDDIASMIAFQRQMSELGAVSNNPVNTEESQGEAMAVSRTLTPPPAAWESAGFDKLMQSEPTAEFKWPFESARKEAFGYLADLGSLALSSLASLVTGRTMMTQRQIDQARARGESVGIPVKWNPPRS